MLQDYFQLPIGIQQFCGQWLQIDAADQTQLGGAGQLGVSTVAGERVWDVQSKVRVRLGPLAYPDYESFLPDRAPVKERKGFFLLSHLVRLYVGLDMDFDVQLVLRAADVPACCLAANGGLGPRLGWNTWVHSGSMPRDAEDAVFEGAEVVWLGGA
jgi:type VI secretion system protein ImpH